jgi:hypothetical protein
VKKAAREEERNSEDDIVLEKLGPRGVPGEASPTKLTPQAAKQLPRGNFDGHTT